MMRRSFLLFALVLAVAANLALLSVARAQLAATPMLLVADPQLQDPLFSKSVVLVTRHGRSRPIGVILNHPADASGSVPEESHFVGGPVSPNSVVCLFEADGKVAPNLLSLGDNLYIGFGGNIAEELRQRQPQPTHLRLFNGFSMWAKGQLENEIARGDWVPLPLDSDVVFKADTTNLWQELLARARRQSI